MIPGMRMLAFSLSGALAGIAAIVIATAVIALLAKVIQLLRQKASSPEKQDGPLESGQSAPDMRTCEAGSACTLCQDRAPLARDRLLTKNEYSRPGLHMATVKAVVIHYVGNPGSSAEGNRKYFESLKAGLKNDKGEYIHASSHYIVGLSGEIIRTVPEDEVAYHAGGKKYTDLAKSMFSDSTGGHVQPNDKAIGIETCHPDTTGKFSKVTEDAVVALAADIVRRYHLSRDHVLRHYDVTGKECPKYHVNDPNAWNALVKRIMDAASCVEEETGLPNEARFLPDPPETLV